jgi:hypothetical protein
VALTCNTCLCALSKSEFVYGPDGDPQCRACAALRSVADADHVVRVLSLWRVCPRCEQPEGEPIHTTHYRVNSIPCGYEAECRCRACQHEFTVHSLLLVIVESWATSTLLIGVAFLPALAATAFGVAFAGMCVVCCVHAAKLWRSPCVR